jgi:hypothetical protein
LLIHCGVINRITPAARQLLTEDTSATRIAVLCEDLVSMITVSFAYTSPTPTGFFTDREEAMRWLLKPTL